MAVIQGTRGRPASNRRLLLGRTVKVVLIFIAALLLGYQVMLFSTILYSLGGSSQTSRNSNRESPPSSLLNSVQQQVNNNNNPDRRQQQYNNEHIDGTFNGLPILYKQNSNNNNGETEYRSSHTHCIGDNYRYDAWKQRSCHFSFLCFNTTQHEFVVFQSTREQFLSQIIQQNKFIHASTVMTAAHDNHDGNDNDSYNNNTLSVSIGGINPKWGVKNIPRLQWFPHVVRIDSHQQQQQQQQQQLSGYYLLPPNVVMMPFHSLNGANPGHLVWDDFLPMYTLLRMFGMLENYDNDNTLVPLPMRYVLSNGDRALWATCDLRSEKLKDCDYMIKKFGPLFVGESQVPILATNDFDFKINSGKPKSDLVCAENGLAGIGSLTDHGVIKNHGWDRRDYLYTHNHGRGFALWEFRNFMLRNAGFNSKEDVLLQSRPQRPFRIVFSENSSEIANRKIDFTPQILTLKSSFPNAIIENYTFKDLSLVKQLDVVRTASIFVTSCGGGAVSGMFLPRGASMIVYYTEDGGAENNRRTFKPAMLDWDLLNAMSHLRVHWMPRNSRDDEVDGKALVLLVQQELLLLEESHGTTY